MLVRIMCVVYALGLLVLLAVWMVFAFSGYAIQVNTEYGIWEFPEETTEDGPCLQHETTGRILVKNVDRYVESGAFVVGQTRGFYFIATPEGELHTYPERETWVDACEGAGIHFTGEMHRPSILRSGKLIQFLVVVSSVILVWGVGGAMGLRLLSRRKRHQAVSGRTGHSRAGESQPPANGREQ